MGHGIPSIPLGGLDYDTLARATSVQAPRASTIEATLLGDLTDARLGEFLRGGAEASLDRKLGLPF